MLDATTNPKAIVNLVNNKNMYIAYEHFVPTDFIFVTLGKNKKAPINANTKNKTFSQPSKKHATPNSKALVIMAMR